MHDGAGQRSGDAVDGLDLREHLATQLVERTRLGQDHDVQQALADGAMAYLVKADLSLQELVKRVGQFLSANGTHGNG